MVRLVSQINNSGTLWPSKIRLEGLSWLVDVNHFEVEPMVLIHFPCHSMDGQRAPMSKCPCLTNNWRMFWSKVGPWGQSCLIVKKVNWSTRECCSLYSLGSIVRIVSQIDNSGTLWPSKIRFGGSSWLVDVNHCEVEPMVWYTSPTIQWMVKELQCPCLTNNCGVLVYGITNGQ
jgi:hypothetical protein